VLDELAEAIEVWKAGGDRSLLRRALLRVLSGLEDDCV
jgi:hypothetical protein